jgi:tRNA threonylcarbamoyladenosine biosynthesis protein TsaE
MDKPSTDSNVVTITTESEEETLALGKTIGEAAAPGAEYSGRVTFRHFDAYRLSGAAEFEDAAGDALEDASAVTAVEWAERVSDALPEDRLDVAIEITGDTGRRFSITATGPGSNRILSALKSQYS